MSFVSKNPRFNSTILSDVAAGAVDAPALGSHKLINRSGEIIVVDDTGAETPVAGTNAGACPVGSIISYNPGYYTDANNGTFTLAGGASGNNSASVNALINASGWYVCDGAEVNVGSSPIFNGAGRHVPNLTDDRFIQGSTAAGASGGSSSSSHTHTFAHTHGTNSQLGTITLAHSHTVNAHNHSVPSHRHEFRFALGDQGFSSNGSQASMGSGGQGGAFRYSTNQYQGGSGAGSWSTTYANHTGTTSGTVARYVSTGDTSIQGVTNTTTSSPGTNSQLSNYNASHSHTTNSQSTSTTSVPSVTENRPKFLANFYIMRVF